MKNNDEEIFFSRTNRPISTKLGTKHPLVRWIYVFQIRIIPFSKRKLFSLNQHNGIIIIIALPICVYWLELCLMWATWPMSLLLYYRIFYKVNAIPEIEWFVFIMYCIYMITCFSREENNHEHSQHIYKDKVTVFRSNYNSLINGNVQDTCIIQNIAPVLY